MNMRLWLSFKDAPFFIELLSVGCDLVSYLPPLDGNALYNYAFPSIFSWSLSLMDLHCPGRGDKTPQSGEDNLGCSFLFPLGKKQPRPAATISSVWRSSGAPAHFSLSLSSRCWLLVLVLRKPYWLLCWSMSYNLSVQVLKSIFS